MITSKEFKFLTSMLTSPTTVMCYLPLEIIIDILSRLPVKVLVRFQCVSKGWHALINGQDFIKLHLHRSFKSNTDRTLIVQEQNADFPLDFFSVSFRDNNRFGKCLEIYRPLHCSNTFIDILSCCAQPLHFNIEVTKNYIF